MSHYLNKIAVITGAGSGFGRELALIGADRGMKLVLADIDTDSLEAIAKFLPQKYPNIDILAMPCDVRQGHDVQALADAALKRFGAVHFLFNNAGVGTGGLIWENTEADWEWVLGVNVWGVIHGVRIFTPLMLDCARKEPEYRGHIINTASMAGLLNAPTMGIYNVSKHAVVSLTESLYQDLKLIGAPIGASVLCPYFVPTGIGRSERNRPLNVSNPSSRLTVSQRVSQQMSDKAIAAGKISAADVAMATFAAIDKGQFYIYSHPEMLANVAQRMKDIVSAANPGDPYADAPKIGRILRARLFADDL